MKTQDMERARGSAQGFIPVHDTIEDTHASYNRAADWALTCASAGNTSVVVASHNEPSLHLAVSKLGQLGLEPSSKRVAFGQLMGMVHFVFDLLCASCTCLTQHTITHPKLLLCSVII